MLPIKKGGLSLISAYDTRFAAYAGSLTQCFHDLCNLEANHWPQIANGIFSNQGPQSATAEILDEARSDYEAGRRDSLNMRKYIRFRQEESTLETDDDTTPSYAFPSLDLMKSGSIFGLQKVVSNAISQSNLFNLLEDEENLSKDDKIRLLSCSGPSAGSFLTAFPSRGDLMLEPLVIVDAVRYRLGIPPKCLEHVPANTTCTCGKRHATPSDMLTSLDPHGSRDIIVLPSNLWTLPEKLGLWQSLRNELGFVINRELTLLLMIMSPNVR